MAIIITRNIAMDFGSGFTSVKSDTIYPLTSRWGMWGGGLFSRVADIGTLTLTLKNGGNNSAGLEGYYTPGHTNARSGFDIGTRVRIEVTFLDGPLASSSARFVGRVRSITPSVGTTGERVSVVYCEDFMSELGEYLMNNIPTQVSKRDDQILTTVFADMDNPPDNTDLQTGQDTYDYALYDLQDENNNGLNLLERLKLSGLGYFYVDYIDRTGMGAFENEFYSRTRAGRAIGATSSYTIADANNATSSTITLHDLTMERTINNVLNEIRLRVNPLDIDATATTTLFELQEEQVLSPGETITIKARYNDAGGGGRRIGATDIVDPLVADTHYRFGSSTGGNDLNGDLSITSTIGSNAAEYALTNNSGQAGFLNKLVVVGKAIRAYDPVEVVARDATSKTTYGLRSYAQNMPYQNDVNVAYGASEQLLSQYKDPFNRVTSVGFWVVSDIEKQAADSGFGKIDIGTLVTIKEDMTATDGVYIVNGIEYSMYPNDQVYVRLAVQRASEAQYWILGDSALSLLGNTTVLGW